MCISAVILLCFSNVLLQNLLNCPCFPATWVKHLAGEGRLTLKYIKNGRKRDVAREDYLKVAAWEAISVAGSSIQGAVCGVLLLLNVVSPGKQQYVLVSTALCPCLSCRAGWVYLCPLPKGPMDTSTSQFPPAQPRDKQERDPGASDGQNPGLYCVHNLGLLCTYIAGTALLGKSYVVSSENAMNRCGGVYLRSVNSLTFIDFWCIW